MVTASQATPSRSSPSQKLCELAVLLSLFCIGAEFQCLSTLGLEAVALQRPLSVLTLNFRGSVAALFELQGRTCPAILV